MGIGDSGQLPRQPYPGGNLPAPSQPSQVSVAPNTLPPAPSGSMAAQNTGPELTPPWLQTMAGGQPLSQVEIQQFIRRLLGLPMEFHMVLAWLGEKPNTEGQAGKAKPQQDIQQLLKTLLPNVNPETLAKQLLPKLADAQAQLMKQLTTPGLPPHQREQLQQTLTLLTQVSQQVQQQPMQALQTLLALYLPIHPNTPFQAWIESGSNDTDGESGSSEASNDDALLTMAVVVPTLGTFKVQILATPTAETTTTVWITYPPKAEAIKDPLHRQCITACKATGHDPAPTFVWKTDPKAVSNSDSAPSAPKIMTFPEAGIAPASLALGFVVAKTLLSAHSIG